MHPGQGNRHRILITEADLDRSVPRPFKIYLNNLESALDERAAVFVRLSLFRGPGTMFSVFPNSTCMILQMLGVKMGVEPCKTIIDLSALPMNPRSVTEFPRSAVSLVCIEYHQLNPTQTIWACSFSDFLHHTTQIRCERCKVTRCQLAAPGVTLTGSAIRG
ncbi:hypothetical protein PROFUN_11532 [Planoprotostelium fungivorum]|uniref:Uncharacterized protein n=1 Tax=Planoprotostelium fungivorum TaxID=1890364 RepID=A0A2P6NA22_9EUKA|nr:hypothetical protein PROFUN_11532 [Planoprotostelium fungivorum]